MPTVSGLTIKKQTGTDGTYYATWKFSGQGKATTSSSGAVKAGNLVSIKSEATKYYNGVAIPAWVKKEKWYVTQVKGDRAVLGKCQKGDHNIQSPIAVKYLSGGTGSSTSTSSGSEDKLDFYRVTWYYDTGDSVWFKASTSEIKEKQSTYSPPSNAIRIRLGVKPVSKTYTTGSNNKTAYYWTGTEAWASYAISATQIPDKPPVPTVEIEKYKLTASVDNISDSKVADIEFQVYNGTKLINSGTAPVLACQASFTCGVDAGGEYRVRCRAIGIAGTAKAYSEWSDFSGSNKAIPSPPKGITICRASSETSVYLEWTAVSTAKTYDIEYTTKKKYFDGSDQTTTVTGIEFTHYEKTGLTSGQEYFFRVRSVNEKGESTWSPIASTIVGKAPSAPTTWSSTTTAIVGDPLNLYWVHNSEDGSSQTYAELEIYFNDTKYTYTIKNTTDPDLKDKTSSYSVDTSTYSEGTKIKWRVRTAGVTKKYGDWSVQRTIDIYATPTLVLSVINSAGTAISTLTAFPFYVSALAGPNTQAPIGYYVSITSNQAYETVDNIGNPKTVNEGEEVYSKYFDTSDALMVELSAGNVDLANSMEYKITCVVSMNSGLTAEASTTISVSWAEVSYEPDAAVSIDDEAYVAYITPCCKDENDDFIEGVSLSVYRREFDGSFTELASGLDNVKNVSITDPHPALDYARYRVVATTMSTGTVSYYDLPGFPVGCNSVIIQWDDDWSDFDVSDDDLPTEPTWTGSMLKLPYNIDVSDSNSIDVSLVEYIGRKHPVSYYGSQLGATSTWNVEIPKYDKETLYAIRRLAIWTGDVYVREPSGSGYWANISVSYSQKHLDLTIPISFNVTRVEGGA